jgi:Phage ABA sandwich domain
MTPAEINEAVARKLGFLVFEAPYNPDGMLVKDSNGIINKLPAYSTSIEAAFEIVEFVAKQSLYFQLDSWQDAEHSLWTAEFVNKEGEIESDDSADTAPMAIALAFLKLEDSK